MVIQCGGGEGYNNQIDPTIDLTYEVNKGILTDLQNYFPDEFIHMGGDEVFGACWDRRPSIAKWMKKHNISDYYEL